MLSYCLEICFCLKKLFISSYTLYFQQELDKRRNLTRLKVEISTVIKALGWRMLKASSSIILSRYGYYVFLGWLSGTSKQVLQHKGYLGGDSFALVDIIESDGYQPSQTNHLQNTPYAMKLVCSSQTTIRRIHSTLTEKD